MVYSQPPMVVRIVNIYPPETFIVGRFFIRVDINDYPVTMLGFPLHTPLSDNGLHLI